MTQMQPVADRRQWNGALRQLPAPHVLQTWEWGAFKERHGWQAERWLWEDSGTARAAALVLNRPVGLGALRLMYIPKGPLLDYDDLPLLERVLGDLEGLARARRAVLVKADPDVRVDTSQGATVMACLARRGWRAARQQVQFRSTLLLDLTRDLDDILAGMKSKWRYNIRLAVRRGVTVRPGGVDDIPLLYLMYLETSQRDHFVVRPEAYYRDLWGMFIAAGLAQPFIAEVEGEPVAMTVLFCFADRAWYMYGASRDRHRESMPNHLLQWEAIRWAKAQGCTVYDLWGAPEQEDEADPLWGVYRFKQGFGAEWVRHIGAYDFPVSGALYWLYEVLAPRLLALMRWRHWQNAARQGGLADSDH